MFFRPAAAPSRATGFAGSLMRRRLRLLQGLRLTRLFLSLSQTAKQVRGRRGEGGPCWEILRHTFSSCLLASFKSFFLKSFSPWMIYFFCLTPGCLEWKMDGGHCNIWFHPVIIYYGSYKIHLPWNIYNGAHIIHPFTVNNGAPSSACLSKQMLEGIVDVYTH